MNRKYWTDMLLRVAHPVLSAAAQGKLKDTLPQLPYQSGRERITNLESVGRVLYGMSPWLELGADDTEEGKLRENYAKMARAAICDITDPASPDYALFDTDGNKPQQPLVDAAFLANAVVRAPKELFYKLSEGEKLNFINALKATRKMRAGYNNWLLFSALVEIGLKVMGQEYDPVRIDYSVRQHEQWYLGNGAYSDGPHFAFDYYNSYVIQPMLVDASKHFSEIYSEKDTAIKDLDKEILNRAQSYAGVLEKMIAADGSYPPIGRSIVYRTGAFQVLSQMALMEFLPDSTTPAAVRCALSAVIKKTLEAENTFDEKGFLKVGLCGEQPGLAEVYIAVSSLYLCTAVFLPLGLPSDNKFWTDPDEKWTQVKLWNGEDIDVYKGH